MALAVLFIAALALNAVASIPAPLQFIDMPIQCQYDGIIGHCATVDECPHSGTSDKDSSWSSACKRYGMVCCTLPTSQRQAASKTSEDTSASEGSTGYEDVADRVLDEESDRVLDEESNRVLDEESNIVLDEESNRVLDEESKRVLDEESNRVLDEESNRVLDEDSNRVLDEESNIVLDGGALYNDKCEESNSLTKLPNPECCGLEAASYSSNSENRIYNGERTKREQFPWMVRIFKPENITIDYTTIDTTTPRAVCGGALIGARHVLTAGHCDHDMESPIDIGLGCSFDENEPNNCEKLIRVAQSILNHKAPGSDIVILELGEPAPFTDTIRPICLPGASEPPARLAETNEKRVYSISGWGRTESGRRSMYKMWAKIPHVPSEECEQIVRELCRNGTGKEEICGKEDEPKLEGRICARGETKDPCVGDSGGPLMLEKAGRFQAVGIITGQTKKKLTVQYSCGEPGVPNLFLDITTHLDWIRDTLKD